LLARREPTSRRQPATIHDEAAAEVRDCMVHPGLLWRLRPGGG
jgi:hypothetical protein